MTVVEPIIFRQTILNGKKVNDSTSRNVKLIEI